MNDDLKTGRTTPPDDDEWVVIWPAIEKANRSWIIVGPIWSVVSNWKSLCVVGAVISFVKSDDIISIVRALLGAVQ